MTGRDQPSCHGFVRLLGGLLFALLAWAATGCGPDCGEGTVERDGECVRATPPCQAGTHEDGGVCVPDVECGEGTHPEGGDCVPDVECGEGTHPEGGDCVPDVECGEGTYPEGGDCLPEVECGPGTVAEGGDCVPIEPQCGEGTRLEGEICVWDDGIAVETPWETDIVVVPAAGYRAEVSLDVDSRGNAYAAWIDVDERTGMSWVKVAVLASGETAFADPITIDSEAIGSGSDFFQGDPTVLVDDVDRAYVGWCNYFEDGSAEVVVSYSDDGETWSESMLASAGAAGNFNDRPWLSFSPLTGTLYVTYLSIEGNWDYTERISISEDGGESWGAFDEFAIIDRRGNYMIAYYSPLVATSTEDLLIPGTRLTVDEENELFMAYRPAEGGDSFRARTLDIPIYASRDLTWGVRPVLAEASDGTLYLSFIDAPDGSMGVYLTQSTDGGATFDTPVRASGPQGAVQTMLWMDVDEDDQAHLIWLDNREGRWRVLHRHTTDGIERLSPLYAVSDETFSGTTGAGDYWLGDFLGLAVRDGWVYAAWTDSRGAHPDIYFSRADLRE